MRKERPGLSAGASGRQAITLFVNDDALGVWYGSESIQTMVYESAYHTGAKASFAMQGMIAKW